ncbi:hypothetical protein VMT65_24130 [Nocardia sp. CDC153]|uniref:hypothetical protein n=1 Tax=Nocardia sp. CDC153 TaxID=3112167 RepID=UPI002DB94DA6|nr:hypothetical protein [Nocardia sp. CDC153]MEC3956147.1 hypothetical protein [Nocardia sp. CDC153]
MTARPLARLAAFTTLAIAALTPMAAAGADTALPDGLHCDTLDCRNDTDQDYVVSGYMQCEYSDADGGGTSGSEQFTDIVPAHSLTRLLPCIDGQSPYLRSIDDVE